MGIAAPSGTDAAADVNAAARAALAERIDALLPQTQCTRCGFPACRPYADALADGTTDLNRCPPGGDAGIRRLAALLDRPYRPLDPACGVEAPRRVALVDESRCIGCTLCIQACPVDAIVGAPKLMHTVVTSLCSGCDLCAPKCPVDCIVMVDAAPDDVWDEPRMDAARARHHARDERLARERAAHEAKLATLAAAIDARAARPASGSSAAEEDAAARRAVIDAARARVRARRAARDGARNA